MGIDIAYLPGLTMRRLADLHRARPRPTPAPPTSSPPPHANTPATLRRVGGDDDILAEPGVLAGYDDLAQQTTRLTNRLRDALLHVHPALERLLGKHIDRGVVTTTVREVLSDLLAVGAAASSRK